MASLTSSSACLRLSAITIAVATAAAAAIGGSAQATAAPSDVPFRAQAVNGQSILFEIERGAMAVEQGVLTVRNAAGTTVATQELKYYRDGRAYPINATVTGRTATFSPVTDAAKSTKVAPSQLPGAKPAYWKIDGPQTRQERDDKALQQFITDLGNAMTVSSIVGMVIGGIIGCIFGIPLFVLGCIPGAMLGMSFGSILGSMLGGGGGIIGAVRSIRTQSTNRSNPSSSGCRTKSGNKTPPKKKN